MGEACASSDRERERERLASLEDADRQLPLSENPPSYSVATIKPCILGNSYLMWKQFAGQSVGAGMHQ